MKRSIVLKSIIVSLILIGCKGNNSLGEFVQTACPIPVPQELVESGKFSYGYMKVPEFHKNPDGKAIELAVAVFQCRSEAMDPGVWTA